MTMSENNSKIVIASLFVACLEQSERPLPSKKLLRGVRPDNASKWVGFPRCARHELKTNATFMNLPFDTSSKFQPYEYDRWQLPAHRLHPQAEEELAA